MAISTIANATQPVDTQESHPGIGRESRYAEAVIAFNKRKTEEAVKILNELLKESPLTVEYLELKALALKGKGDEKTSLEVYQQLYQAKPENERGPYAYEIASLLNKQNKFEEARPYFEKSAALKFNAGPSHLFLGIGHFNAARYTEAQLNFDQALGTGIIEIEMIAQYYKSLSLFKLYFSTRGVQEIVETETLAKKVLQNDPSNANAKNILDASEKMLQPFSKGQWFGNAAFSTQYDSNIMQLPTGLSNTQGSSNASTIKENILAGLGFMSAPAGLVQIVAGYRASYNKNFNSDTKRYEYFTNNLSFNFNYKALAKTTYGLKLDSNFMFENAPIDPADAGSEFEFQKFNYTYGGGAYIRHQLNDYWRAEGEVNYRKQNYFSDSDQSGNNLNMSLSARRSAGDRYFNPGASLAYEINNANGSSIYYRAYGFGISNSMNFPALLTLNQGIDLLFSNYEKLDPVRKDSNMSFRLGALKFITPKISVMADLNYIKNISTVSTSYSYNRFMSSLGIGFTL